MANITRKYQKLFAGNALNNGQFGSKQLGTDIESNDIEVLQALSAYNNGWNDAVISGEDLPPLEEIQGLQYKTDYQLSYLLQKGFPEWNNQTDYYIGDLSRPVADTKIYKSIVNNNIGNALTDITKWQLLGDLANLGVIQQATTTNLGYSFLTKRIIISNSGLDPNNDVNFNAGVFQFSDGTGQAALTSLTKRLDANWASGTNQGGLDSGVKAINTWYHCYAIYNPTTLAEDALFSKGAITPNVLPSGYTKFKRVGSIITNSAGNILQFTQFDKKFHLRPQVENRPLVILSGPSIITVTAPFGLVTEAICSITYSISNFPSPRYVLINSLSDPSNIASINNYTMIIPGTSASLNFSSTAQREVATNTSSQINIATSAPGSNIQVYTDGWIDYEL